MAKRRKGLKGRIDEELERLSGRPRDVEEAIKDLFETDWGPMSRVALTLDNDDEALKSAFAAADLDPNNPFHWAELARSLANIRFGLKKAGRPKILGSVKLGQLVKDVAQIRKKHPKLSDKRICEKLAREDQQYARWHRKPDTLRRRYHEGKSNIGAGRAEEERRELLKKWGMTKSLPLGELIVVLKPILASWPEDELK